MWLLFNKLGNLSIYYTWNIQASNFFWMFYLKCFGTSLFDSTIFQFYPFDVILTEKELMLYPLTCASICQQRTLAMAFSDFVVLRSCKCRNQQTRLAITVQYEKWLLRHLLVFFADKKWSPLLDCYVINSATLQFITFEVCKHLTSVECNTWKYLEPSKFKFGIV